MGRKFLIGMVVAIVAIVLVCAFGGRLASRFAPTPTPTPLSAIGAEEPVVTAKGVIVPIRYARLGFEVSGTLAWRAVKEGEVVKAGQLLARLDTADLELAVRAAEARLAQVKAVPRPEDIAAAEASLAAAQAGLKQAQGALASAQANLDRLLAGPTQLELEMARREIEQARNRLWGAQAERDGVKGNPANPSYLKDAAEAVVSQAEIGVRMAELRYEQIKAGARQEEIAAARAQVQQAQGGLEAARAQVAQAKAQLDRAKAGPRPEDIALAEVELERAKIALEKAQLHAPFAGTVVSITAREWETVVLSAPIITLADLSELRVETTDLDEWGAARVKVGDAARITVNAFKDKVLTGKVVAIAKQGVTLPTGDVAYTVTIALDKQDPELRWGMTVKVEFR